MTGILARLTPAELAWLDPVLRRAWDALNWQLRGRSWFIPERFEPLLDSGRFPPALLGLASMHPSGHVREAAVRRLALGRDGSEVTFLLLRVNDWVAEVREAARTALLARLVPEAARHLIPNLPLVDRLSECRRDDHVAIVELVSAQLRDPRSRQALLDGLSSPDRLVRRACFGLALDAPGLSPAEFLARMVRHDDPMLRLRAAREARSRLAAEDYFRLIPGMAGDRSMPVRREALVGRVAVDPDGSGPALLRALLDPHPSLREVARHHLGKSGNFDARRFYRDAVLHGDPSTLAPAVAGLGEVGAREDAELIVPRLDHPVTKVRAVAVRALANLDGDSHVEALLHALGDPRSGVAHQARRALRGRVNLVAADRLWRVFEYAARPHTRRHTLVLLAGLGKWASLPFLLRASRDDDPGVAALARLHLRNWIDDFNRSFAAPSPADLQRAWVALDESAASLDPETDTLIRFHLAGW